MARIALVARVVAAVLGVAYPGVVYWSLRAGEPLWAVAALGVIAGLGALARWAVPAATGSARGWVALGAVVATGVVARLSGDPRALFAAPVLVNAGFLAAFATTLRRGATPMIERFARLVERDLTPAKQAHCREATVAWCGYFALNVLVSGALAVRGDVAVWALFTGPISYGLMGLLFAVEVAVRVARFGPPSAGLLGALVSRMLPRRR